MESFIVFKKKCMATPEESLLKIKDLVSSIEADIASGKYAKFSAARVRSRRNLSELKKLAFTLRVQLQENGAPRSRKPAKSVYNS